MSPTCTLSQALTSKFTSGIWLAQTARLSMAAFQLAAYITPAVIQPLYTSDTFALITPSVLAILNAVGFANIAMYFAIRAANTKERHVECWLINTVTMAATALVYAVFPVKPPHVSVPFELTLCAVAVVNLLNLKLVWVRGARKESVQEASAIQPSIIYRLAQYCKVAVAVGALVLGLGMGGGVEIPVIARVYWLQVALNVSIAGVMACRFWVPTLSDVVVTFGLAACLAQGNGPVGVLAGCSALLLVGAWAQKYAAELKGT